MNFKFKIFKEYLLGFMIGISFFFGTIYASNNISGLFEKISGQWKIDGLNIKENSITHSQLGTNSIITSKILDKSITESKLSDSIITKINSPLVTEIDPTAIKLTGNEIISGVKTFIIPIIGVNPVSNNDYTTKSYVDSIVSTLTYTYSWNIGSWGSCSVSCGGGTQSRTVNCQRSDLTIVSDSFCSGIKPVISQICNTGSCGTTVCSCNWSVSPSFSYQYNVYLPADCTTSGSTTTCSCGKSMETNSSACTQTIYTLGGGVYPGNTCNYTQITTRSFPQNCYTVVNGTCGSSNGITLSTVPTTNLCNTGTASSVTTNTTNYTWTCNGSGGGTNSSCSANRTISCPSGWVLVGTKCQSALRGPNTYLNGLNDCSSLSSNMVAYDSNFRGCGINSSDICLSDYLLQWVYSTNTDYGLRYVGGSGGWGNANISNYSISGINGMFQDDLNAGGGGRDGTHYYRCIK